MKRSSRLGILPKSVDTDIMTKAEMVRKLEKAYACEDYFPGVLGNPVTFAARWGLLLSEGYLRFKEKQLRASKRLPRTSATKSNGVPKPQERTRAK